MTEQDGPLAGVRVLELGSFIAGPFAPMAGVVPQFSRTPGSVRAAGPRLGEHTRAVLREYGAVDDATFDELEKRGVVVDGATSR